VKFPGCNFPRVYGFKGHLLQCENLEMRKCASSIKKLNN
jgi:hypothetical protein